MIYRSKAPLRIGLAGGGTDVSPYPDNTRYAVIDALNAFGGEIKNYSFTQYGLSTWTI